MFHFKANPAEEPYLNVLGMGRLPVIRQDTSTECGLACVAMIAGYFGYAVDLVEFRRLHSVSMRGSTLADLVDLGDQIGLGSRVLRASAQELKGLRCPCILHWDFDHFVVLKSVSGKGVTIHDPAAGARRLDWVEVDRRYTGVALELTPTAKFKTKTKPTGLTLFRLIRFDRSFVSSFSLGLLFSLIVELLVLSLPFYMQLTVDEVLLKGDTELLGVLALAFGAIVLFQAIASGLRSLTFQYLSHVLGFDMAARVFNRAVKLPSSYFTKRQLGDVQHRIQGIEQVNQFLVSGAPMVLLDGIFGVIILAILYAYSPTLTAIAIGVVALYIGWRIALFGLMKRAAGDVIRAEAESQTHLLETLRAMPTLKALALESVRESGWRNANARKLNAGLRLGNLNIANAVFNTFLFEGLRVLVLFLGAKYALSGEMSIGMVTAFMAYFAIFTQRTTNLVDQLIAMRLLRVPLDRIADIVLSEAEPLGSNGGREGRLRGRVAIQRLAFSYGQSESPVLQGASFNVEPGEFVAIVGASGAGKSTLLRLLAGMERPQHGQLLFDDRPLKLWNLTALRRQLGIVLQSDTLFRGTIAENVAFFQDRIDMDRVRNVCEMTHIAREIEAMPMGYDSLVGDMGSSLSGGQNQRLLLARALYREPAVLLLDEATSHLDPFAEKAVLASLQTLGMTRLVAAHRPGTVAAADRVFAIEGGRVREIQKPQSE